MPHGHDEPRIGAVFDGRYQVASRRTGDDGVLVCDAVRLTDVRPVVLVVGAAGAVAEPAGAEQFAQDGARLARLRHPGLVAVVEASVAQGARPYLVLEPVEGRGLEVVVAEEAPFVPRRVAAIGGEVLRAVEGLHGHGVALGGVLAEDVTVTALEDGREVVRVAPHGVVRRPQGREATLDVAAIGALMFELLTGVAPRAGVQGPVAPTLAGATVIGPLVDFVGGCMQAGAAGGYESAAAAVAALAGVDPEATETAPGARAPAGELLLAESTAAPAPSEPPPRPTSTAIASPERRTLPLPTLAAAPEEVAPAAVPSAASTAPPDPAGEAEQRLLARWGWLLVGALATLAALWTAL